MPSKIHVEENTKTIHNLILLSSTGCGEGN